MSNVVDYITKRGQIKIYVIVGVVDADTPLLPRSVFYIPSASGNLEKAGEILKGAAAFEFSVLEDTLYYEVYLNEDDTIPVKFSMNSPYAAKLVEA